MSFNSETASADIEKILLKHNGTELLVALVSYAGECAREEAAAVREELKLKPAETLVAPGPLFSSDLWFRDPHIRRAWAHTWEQSHMKAGMQVLHGLGLPGRDNPEPPGKPIEFCYGIFQGYFAALGNIESLKKDRLPLTSPGRIDGWGEANLNKPPVK